MNLDTLPIAACPTYFKGARMRSRTEARYAKWLDRWADWTYEPFAFADGLGEWRPDFQILDVQVAWHPTPVDVFVEVKPGRWLTERPVDAAHMVDRMSSAFATFADAVLIIELSGTPGRPTVVLPGGEMRAGRWMEGVGGRPALGMHTSNIEWGDRHVAAA